MEITFGPVYSRRFGWSLGVDLSPQKKQCNFDCVYCELKGAKTMESMEEILSPELILESVKKSLHDTSCDVLSITANGEPTLYPHLDILAQGLREILPSEVKLLILSNGSLLWKKSVREALRHFDIVKFSCDAISPKAFKKVDRPHSALQIEQIKEGMAQFCAEFEGKLVAEVLFVSGLNDTLESAREIASFLNTLGAKRAAKMQASKRASVSGEGIIRVDIGSIDRPPAYSVKPVSVEQLQSLAECFRIHPYLEVSIPQRDSQTSPQIQNHNEDSLLGLIRRRPLSKNDTLQMFDKPTLALLEQMCQKNLIQVHLMGENEFYQVVDSALLECKSAENIKGS